MLSHALKNGSSLPAVASRPRLDVLTRRAQRSDERVVLEEVVFAANRLPS